MSEEPPAPKRRLKLPQIDEEASERHVTMMFWTVLNIVVPLLPLVATAFLLSLQKQALPWAKQTDLLFFALVLSSSCILDIFLTVKNLHKELLWGLMFVLMSLSALGAALLYGFLLYNLNGPQPESADAIKIREHLYPYARNLGLSVGFFSLVSKYLLLKVVPKT